MTENPREVYVYNETKRTLLAFRVRVAESPKRLIGLERESIKPGEGRWISPAHPIHIIWSGSCFDAVMIDNEFRVVSTREMVKPYRVFLRKSPAESVIELPPHTIFQSRTRVGDQLKIDRY